MKRSVFVGIGVVAAMLFSCSKDHSADYALFTERGSLQLSVNLGKVGALQKTAALSDSAIEIAYLVVSLSAAGQSALLDTIVLTGGSQERTEQKTYADLAAWTENEAIEWTLAVESFDKSGKIIHAGDTVFTLEPEDTLSLPMILKARYSMVTANFYPIRDSVTRCELVIDGDTASAQEISFQKQSRLGDTVEVTDKYLTASPSGISHRVTLKAYGVSGGAEALLYKGDTAILVKSGEDKKYNVQLKYVGNDSLLSAFIMMATLGSMKKTSDTVTNPDIASKLFLWNKLGSKNEVEHSEVGPNGLFDNAEGELTFEPFYHGSGVRYPYLGAGKNKCKIAFNLSSVNFSNEVGCIEFWWKAGFTDNAPYDTGSAGVRAFFSTSDTVVHPPNPPYNAGSGFMYMFNNNYLSTLEDMSFYIGLADTAKIIRAATPASYQGFTKDEIVHWACTYNVHGINNSDTTAIIYKNGVIIAATKSTWPISKIKTLWLGAHPWTVWYQSVRTLAYGPADGVYDNLKIWKYAKTDFSDRFTE